MIQISMSNEEIQEACREWLQKHGAPSDGLTLRISTATPLKLVATVEVEAPEFGGPYR